MRKTWKILAGCLVIGCLIAQSHIAAAESKKPKQQQGEVKAQDKTQAKRLSFIKELMRKGIFQKIDVPGLHPHLWVKPAFHSLDFETKQEFVGVVYAYYVTDDPSVKAVDIYDNRTGKQIGSFSKMDGGLKLY